MEILGIGPLELIFIFLIALIVLGPTDMVKAGRTIGRFLRRIVTSPGWRTFQQASREMRYLPNKLMREAGLEELERDLEEIENKTRQATNHGLDSDLETWQRDISSWTSPPKTIGTPGESPQSNHKSESSEPAADQSTEETEQS
jgi:Sec-independent protein translocase protein TatA